MVDDSTEDAELAAHTLRVAGWTVEFCWVENADQLQEALGTPWDLCLLDWVMPDASLTAPEAMRLMASAQPRLPVVIWSGKYDPKVAWISTDVLNAKAFLHKAELARLPGLVRDLGFPQ